MGDLLKGATTQHPLTVEHNSLFILDDKVKHIIIKPRFIGEIHICHSEDGWIIAGAGANTETD